MPKIQLEYLSSYSLNKLLPQPVKLLYLIKDLNGQDTEVYPFLILFLETKPYGGGRDGAI